MNDFGIVRDFTSDFRLNGVYPHCAVRARFLHQQIDKTLALGAPARFKKILGLGSSEARKGLAMLILLG